MENEIQRIFIPDYMTGFQCIAGDCRHSCCIGWEIDIDEDSLIRYKSTSGPFAGLFSRYISESEDGSACFLLQGKEERCPFLNERNLCDLILNLGEDSLCQICRDHPRFRNEIGSRTEMGLGLCCEEAARIILFSDAPFRFGKCEYGKEKATWTETSDPLDGLSAEDDTYYRDLLLFRNELFTALHEPGSSFSCRLEKICEKCHVAVPSLDLRDWGDFLFELERLDPSWNQELSRLQNAPGISFSEEIFSTPVPSRLLAYFLFRHISGAQDDDLLTERVLFCIVSTLLLCALFTAHQKEDGELSRDTLIEISRLFSSEIEYSDENIPLMLDRIHELYF